MARRTNQVRFTSRVRARSPGTPVLDRGPVLLAIGVYGALSLLALALAAAADRSPIEGRAWLPVEGALAHAASAVLGAALACATVRATRSFVRRFRWARALHAGLRPSVRFASGPTLLVLGLTSAVGEELFFRGLLVPSVGLVLSSVGFGLLHQVRGSGRWAWAGWATVMGLLFGGLYLLTGSLLGPVLAHALINVQNLRFLRDTEVAAEPPPRRLGGLLGRA